MSFSFYVPVSDPPSLQAIEKAVDLAGWRVQSEVDVLAEGAVCHPLLIGRSARGVELAYEQGRLQVRIMTCSSHGDHELALAIVRAVAKPGVMIDPEDGESMAVDALLERHGPDWIDEQVLAGTGYPLSLAADGQTITLSAPRRSFYLGPRLHAELASAGDGTIGERLLAAMIALQAIDDDDFYKAEALEVSRGEEAFTLAVWAPEVSYLFPPVERFAIIRDDGSSFMIPAERGPEVGGDAWRWVDERQAIVAARTGYPWVCMVELAHEHAIPGTEIDAA
ncbi:MAG: hypothetical protein WKG01_00640 [Kofleriaceae bacterium]